MLLKKSQGQILVGNIYIQYHQILINWVWEMSTVHFTTRQLPSSCVSIHKWFYLSNHLMALVLTMPFLLVYFILNKVWKDYKGW